MNSKDWKLSLFALAALISLSACGDKKKKEAGFTYAGIWVNQDNWDEFSPYRSGNATDNRPFCERVHRNFRRYADNQYQMRAMLVQNTGEVFRYAISQFRRLFDP